MERIKADLKKARLFSCDSCVSWLCFLGAEPQNTRKPRKESRTTKHTKHTKQHENNPSAQIRFHPSNPSNPRSKKWGGENHPVSRSGCHPSFGRRGVFLAKSGPRYRNRTTRKRPKLGNTSFGLLFIL